MGLSRHLLSVTRRYIRIVSFCLYEPVVRLDNKNSEIPFESIEASRSNSLENPTAHQASCSMRRALGQVLSTLLIPAAIVRLKSISDEKSSEATMSSTVISTFYPAMYFFFHAPPSRCVMFTKSNAGRSPHLQRTESTSVLHSRAPDQPPPPISAKRTPGHVRISLIHDTRQAPSGRIPTILSDHRTKGSCRTFSETRLARNTQVH